MYKVHVVCLMCDVCALIHMCISVCCVEGCAVPVLCVCWCVCVCGVYGNTWH